MPRTVASVVAVLAALLVGCGGESNDSPDSATSAAGVSAETTPTTTEAPPATTAEAEPTGISHQELVKEVNAICEDYNGSIADEDAEAQKLNAAGDYQGLADLYEGLSGQAAGFFERLEALEPSAEDRKAFNAYVGAVKQQNGLMDRAVTALRNEDDGAIATLGPLIEEAGQKRISAAIELGADKCGQA